MRIKLSGGPYDGREFNISDDSKKCARLKHLGGHAVYKRKLMGNHRQTKVFEFDGFEKKAN